MNFFTKQSRKFEKCWQCGTLIYSKNIYIQENYEFSYVKFVGLQVWGFIQITFTGMSNSCVHGSRAKQIHTDE